MSLQGFPYSINVIRSYAGMCLRCGWGGHGQHTCDFGHYGKAVHFTNWLLNGDCE